MRNKVLELSKDGVLSIEAAGNSMKLLAKQGVDAQQAFDFLDAAKKVSSFGNIVGSASLGVENFVLGLSSASVEMLENMDPALRKVIKDLGGSVKISEDATAKQKLLNEVIRQGGELTADYANFSRLWSR